jgi:hypothetical protein
MENREQKRFKPKHLREFSLYKFSEIEVGDRVQIHNTREATRLTVTSKSDSERKLFL